MMTWPGDGGLGGTRFESHANQPPDERIDPELDGMLDQVFGDLRRGGGHGAEKGLATGFVEGVSQEVGCHGVPALDRGGRQQDFALERTARRQVMRCPCVQDLLSGVVAACGERDSGQQQVTTSARPQPAGQLRRGSRIAER
jgi:hypothetical protein